LYVFYCYGLCVCVCLRVCACLVARCIRATVRTCVRAYMRACVHVCVRACVHACMRATVSLCACICVCVCVRACVRASVWMGVCWVGLYVYMCVCGCAGVRAREGKKERERERKREKERERERERESERKREKESARAHARESMCACVRVRGVCSQHESMNTNKCTQHNSCCIVIGSTHAAYTYVYCFNRTHKRRSRPTNRQKFILETQIPRYDRARRASSSTSTTQASSVLHCNAHSMPFFLIRGYDNLPPTLKKKDFVKFFFGGFSQHSSSRSPREGVDTCRDRALNASGRGYYGQANAGRAAKATHGTQVPSYELFHRDVSSCRFLL